jgi:hypothetical protein
VLGATGAAYAVADRRADAERILRDPHALDGQSSYAQASVHAALGNRDRAFALLDQAAAQRYSSAPDPTFNSLRNDPRMPVLLRRTGLPAGEQAYFAADTTSLGFSREEAAFAPGRIASAGVSLWCAVHHRALF